MRRVYSSLSFLLVGVVGLAACSPDPASAPPEARADEASESDPLDGLDLLPPPLPPAASVPFEPLRGELRVGDDATANYTVPLPTPAGRRGVSPALSVHYNSSANTGPLGLGWSVAYGGSAITLCPKTPLVDGLARAVERDGTDPFCLDGERLVLVSGAAGVDGAEYRTRRESFARVVLRNDATFPIATGFEVWTKDGTVQYYGKSSRCMSSQANTDTRLDQGCDGLSIGRDRKPTSWLLFRRQDRFGNYIDYHYARSFSSGTDVLRRATPDSSGVEETWIDTIEYTGHIGLGLAPSRRVRFDYEDRSRPAYGWYLDERTTLSRRLRAIAIEVNGVKHSETRFSYTIDGVETLASITQCDGDGVCEPSSNFSYSPPAGGFRPAEDVGTSPPEDNGPRTEAWAATHPIALDFNGDGMMDVTYPMNGHWVVKLGSPTTPLATEIHTSAAALPFAEAAAIDFNSDGRGDLLLFESPTDHDPNGRWRVLLAEGIDFRLLDTGLARPDAVKPDSYACCAPLSVLDGHTEACTFVFGFTCQPSCANCSPTAGLFRGPDVRPYASERLAATTRLLDMDGDTRADLLVCSASSGDRWVLHRRDTSGGLLPGLSLGTSASCAKGRTIVADMNLDGADDVLFEQNGAFVELRWSLQSGGGISQRPISLPVASNASYFAMDVNGDGLPDIVSAKYHPTADPRGAVRLFINTGSELIGWGSGSWEHGFLGIPANAVSTGAFSQAVAFDYDRDGRIDILVPEVGTPDMPSAVTAFTLLKNRGLSLKAIGNEAFFSTESISDIPYDASNSLAGHQADLGRYAPLAYPKPRVADFDGDGISDLLLIHHGRLVLRRGQGEHQRPQLVAVWEGRPQGASDAAPPDHPTYHIRYGNASDDAIYQHGSRCDWPQVCLRPSHPLVAETRADTGPNRPRRSLTYQYRDSRSDHLLRAWIGFASVTQAEVEEGFSTTRWFKSHVRGDLVYSYPWLGIAERVEATVDTGNGTILTDVTTSSWDFRVTAGGLTYFAYPTASVRTHLERRSGASPVSIHTSTTSYSTPDVYGNASTEQFLSEGEITTVVREFQNDVPRWLIGMLREETVTHALDFNEVYTRKTRYVPDPVAGALASIEIEPNLPLQRRLIVVGRQPTGNVESVDDNGRLSRQLYDRSDEMFVNWSRNAAGHEHWRRTDAATGAVLVTRDENNVDRIFQYDGFGRMVSTSGPPGEATTTTYHWTSVDLREIEVTGSAGALSTTAVDRVGLAVESRGTGPFGVQYARRTNFDHRGLVVGTSAPFRVGSAPIAWDGRTYDRLGRLTRALRPDGRDDVVNEYVGRSVRSTSADGTVRLTELDGLGRVKTAYDADVGQPSTTSASYEYGAFGQLKQAINGAGTTSFGFDPTGRVVSVSTPDTGTRNEELDAFGQLVGTTDANGRVVEFRYDALGRRVRRIDGPKHTAYVYDTAAHGVGKLASAYSPDGNEQHLQYDEYGRLLSSEMRIGSDSFEYVYGYDGAGRVDTIQYPESNGRPFVVKYDYDSAGQVARVEDAASGAAYWWVSDADEQGRYSEESFGNGMRTHRTADQVTGLLLSITTDREGTRIQDLRYGYDVVGRLRYRHDAVGGQLESFNRDAPGRIRTTRLCPESTVPNRSHGIVLDGAFDTSCNATMDVDYSADGNILSKNGVGTYTYHPTKVHAVASAGTGTYGYDQVGNQTERPGQVITYNELDKVREVVDSNLSMTTYMEYGPAGDRVRKYSSNRTETFVGDLYTRVVDHRVAETSHVYAIRVAGRTVAEVWRKPNEDARHYVHYDHLGSPDVITDKTGQVVERLSFDAFGLRRSAKWSDTTAPGRAPVMVGYTGHNHDDEFGLIDMKGRLYDPKLGRFLSPDPVVQLSTDVQSFNRYSYVRNDPVTFADPSGYNIADVLPPAGGGGGSAIPPVSCILTNTCDMNNPPGVALDRLVPTIPDVSSLTINSGFGGTIGTGGLGGGGVGFSFSPAQIAEIRATVAYIGTMVFIERESRRALDEMMGVATNAELTMNSVINALTSAQAWSDLGNELVRTIASDPTVLLAAVPVVGDPLLVGISVVRFAMDPSWQTAANMAMDAAGLLPMLPSGVGTIAGTGSKLNKAAKSARGAATGRAPQRLLPGLKVDDTQIGKKIGKHAEDFGLDASNPADREAVRERIDSIVRRYDDVRQGPWNPRGGGGSDFLFYRQGSDVVVSKPSGDFVTVLRGGSTNGWFNGATSLLP